MFIFFPKAAGGKQLLRKDALFMHDPCPHFFLLILTVREKLLENWNRSFSNKKL